MAEADRIRVLPTVQTLVVSEGTSRSVDYRNRTINRVSISGRSTAWPLVVGGDIFPGRSYTDLEYQSSARVVVVNAALAAEILPGVDPIGKRVKIGGEPFTVIGVHRPPPDLFGDGKRSRAYVPYSSFKKHVRQSGFWTEFLVKPVETVAVSQAIDDVTAALRSIRGLRPAEPNNFDIVTQDKFLDVWNQLTGVFFVVMIALSSVGLMVGGVGVIAVMMISVTERTREIGVRKAMGAKRREILWQFLVEAATLTLVGGAVGMVVGGVVTMLVNALTPLPAEVPMMSVVAALAMSILTGIAFGLYPAAKAARLDPVEALRHE